MLYSKSNALQVCEAALDKIKERRVPVRKIILPIFPLWRSMNSRMTFMNIQRWGGPSEKSYRSRFSKAFDWFGFNYEVVKASFKGKVIAVFDPFYLPKSGKKTYGLTKFYSGTAQRGLEVGCLCFVNVAAGAALHALAEQTPSPAHFHKRNKTLTDHSVGVIKKHLKAILALTRYLAVDGYFMKKEVIRPLVKKGLPIITKMRKDANLRYLYQGPKKGKADMEAPAKRSVPCCYRDREVAVYAAALYAVQLKMKALVAFVCYKGKSKPEIIMSTDVAMDVLIMCRYYGLRFQVEFLIPDAKQHTGLEDCQARSREKLHTHFNTALTAVSLAKCAYWLPLPQQQRVSFSMADVKMVHMNQLNTTRIFDNLALNLSDKKIKQPYDDCLNFGRLRA